ncbi:MAG: ribosome assembly cofactor RimP [Muribaculaceae bacterium]|nr:ribosome assembly cofactor RimP [Muribaculaceae bacterium]
MIDKEKLVKTVEEAIAGTDMFIVDIKVSKNNEIVVEIDSMSSLDIDTCVAISHRIEAEFDRDVEDYQLEVGSAGLTAPFTVKQQYLKNVGNEVEVVTRDGRKFYGTLTEVADETFTVEVPTKVKHEGAKRPVIEPVATTVEYSNAKLVRYKF